MDTLDGFKTVVAVVETGSFTSAAERMGISKALVSKYINLIEAQFGVRLFNRSTRKIQPTEAGMNYYNRAILILDEFSSLVESVSDNAENASGTLKISASLTFGELLLIPRLSRFLDKHPNLKININLTNQKIDLIKNEIDVAVRVGKCDDSTYIARKINDFDFTLCASPDYIELYGQPKNPSDIKNYNCIIDPNLKMGASWPFTYQDNITKTIKTNHTISVNSPKAIRELAIHGNGIALIPSFMVQEDIKNGLLEEILPNYKTIKYPLNVIYPHRKYLPKKVKCFIEFLTQEFGSDRPKIFEL